MHSKKIRFIPLIAFILLVIVLAVLYIIEHPLVRVPSESQEETEAFQTVGDSQIACELDLTLEVYPVGTPTGDWLAGCSDSDRNDQLTAYVLRHENTEGENTTFTYLIYYRHESFTVTASPALLAGDGGGYRVDVTYTPGLSTQGYALTRLTVTLPTQKAPRLRLLAGDDSIGYLSTVTDEPIPSGKIG